ncbi:MAG: glycosyltransferase, partial [Thermodesulfovibrionales bacterium]
MNTSTCKTKTVLHLFSGDLWAGAEVMAYNLLNTLKDFSDLRIIALSMNEGILTQKLREQGIETYVIPENNNSFLTIFLKTLKLSKTMKIDIIHSHRYKENLLAFLLAKSLGVKSLITTMHGLPEPMMLGEHGKFTSSLTTKLNYFLLKNVFTHVVAVSQEMKNRLIQEYRFNPLKIKVIYNGIPIPSTSLSDKNLNLNLNSPLFPSNPRPLESLNPDSSVSSDPRTLESSNPVFHVGTVGRMVPVKDYDLFLEIASEIRKQNDKVRFSIL